MSPLPTKMEKSRTGQEVNYKLMRDLEITARLFHLFGELIGTFFPYFGRSGNVDKSPLQCKSWRTGPQEYSLCGYYPGRQASPQKQLIAWLGIPTMVGLESFITIISQGKHQKKKTFILNLHYRTEPLSHRVKSVSTSTSPFPPTSAEQSLLSWGFCCCS